LANLIAIKAYEMLDIKKLEALTKVVVKKFALPLTGSNIP